MGADLQRRVFVAAIAATLGAVGVWVFHAHEESRVERVRAQQASAAAQLAAAEASLTFQLSAKLLAAVANSSDAPELLGPGCRARVQELRDLNERYRHLSIADPRGILVCSTAAQPRPKASLEDDEVFRRAMRSAHAQASGLVRCPVTGTRGVVLQQPILRDHSVVGMMAASMDFAPIEAVLASVRLPEQATLTVVNDDGVIFAAFPDERLVGQTISEAAVFGRHITAGEDDFFSLSPPEETRQVVAYARITGIAPDEHAYARVTLPAVPTHPELWAIPAGLLVFAVVLVLTGDRRFAGRFWRRPGGERLGTLTGHYRARHDGERYEYEVAWSASAIGLQWEGQVRHEGELVALPSGDIPAGQARDPRRAVRREMEAAIERRVL